jgi:hypothetical protein
VGAGAGRSIEVEYVVNPTKEIVFGILSIGWADGRLQWRWILRRFGLKGHCMSNRRAKSEQYGQ